MASGIVIHLLVGMKAKIKAPVSKFVGEGYFPKEGTVIIDGETRTLTRGFVVENEDVGTIVPSDAAEVAVVYTHKKPEENTVWFFAATGEKGVCTIGHVPIHDHSSIVQGGPAYGTYFNDDLVV